MKENVFVLNNLSRHPARLRTRRGASTQPVCVTAGPLPPISRRFTPGVKKYGSASCGSRNASAGQAHGHHPQDRHPHSDF